MAITIHVPANCSPEQFKRDLDEAIAGLKRMKAAMFKPVPKAIAKSMKRKR